MTSSKTSSFGKLRKLTVEYVGEKCIYYMDDSPQTRRAGSEAKVNIDPNTILAAKFVIP